MLQALKLQETQHTLGILNDLVLLMVYLIPFLPVPSHNPLIVFTLADSVRRSFGEAVKSLGE